MKAYQWLQKQGPQIREIASNPDILVGLYQKAQMHGDEVLERPSIQNFKNELKNLAGMMGELQPGTPTTSVSVSPTSSHQMNGHAASQVTTPTATLAAHTQIPLAQTTSVETHSHTLSSTARSAPSADLKSLLDPKSWAMIQEVKSHLNLSNEHEALRALISLGYAKVKKIIS